MFTLDLQELAIVIAVKNLDPTLLSPEFLHYSNIVPADWELANAPIRNAQAARVSFQNGISLVVQSDRITLVEPLLGKSAETVQVAEIAQRWINVLPSLAYQGIGINTRTLVALPGTVNQTYLSQNLLTAGDWLCEGTQPVRMGLNLSYTFESKRLNLSINEATVQLPEQEQVAVVVFSGNFDYELAGDVAPLARLGKILSAWSADVEQFCCLKTLTSAAQRH
ncbi:MAG: hypothetical protein KME35_06780 [Aphanocapsa sp. GSE-SYN-MK-11-07L]|nr:hypothetical protein [Aphanocapsa sp. GSE-SYN-MK-11-07L]